MAAAYTRIFKRCGLEAKMVQSDTGAIGGSIGHEFMVITTTDSGENDVFYCNSCDYAANSDVTESKLLPAVTDGGYNKPEIIDTPNTKTIDRWLSF